MPNMIRSFRTKMILLLGISMLLAGLITYLIYKVLQIYYRSQVKFEDPLAYFRLFLHKIGDINFFLLFFIPMVILFFFFFTRSYAVYFREISDGIHRLASGDFNSRVHVASNDEFEDIAKDINLASEKLQEAVNRGDFAESSKDQLVLNLAHDLRTPLTSVLGYLDFILRDKELSSEQVRHFTQIAFTKSQRLEKLVDELFEITRMNYGMLKVERNRIDLGELLIQLNEELYPMFEKNQLTLRLNADQPLQLWGDGELLARVFENLLTNAIRYGSDGQYVDVIASSEGEEAVVQVVNYGDSIPPEELPRIFDMFYTADQARNHRTGSTGLGLFITKNIVERHNGTVSVQSNPVRTLFEVRLPKNHADNETSAPIERTI
ncbi:vancomycin resistance histidine kinase VanS [Paenibacillus chitinolyticus]|uniref:sensor histidine kinase n=1 Tax=Paenibacillus chitinolyticus TaxID=79263 RepID=UPI0026E4CDB0|nr:HAMP domain-containing sensor histidine kinase [Paenibacillus chitinolyticus]GKS11012.1 vancomycin resistance histidine kinase VanS [Paenibacillus chitinolyticus]